MKFSIIVPVYNVEKFLDKCLESILKQKYENFEVIIVNDGTKDDSQTIIDKFVKKDKRFLSFIKENGGLSDARNYGISKASGDYIIFVDSDDFINDNLLLDLNSEITNYPELDIIKYRHFILNENGKKSDENNYFSSCDRETAIEKLVKDSILEPAWLYCYRRSFWFDNNFKFEKGKIHEDFGLIPFTLTKAYKLSSINSIGYNYVIRSGSIMTARNEEKLYNNCLDLLEQFEININRMGNSNSEKIIKSFLANGVLFSSKRLNKKYRKQFYNLLKKENIVSYIMNDNFKRKIKKIIIEFCLKFNIKLP